MSDTPASAPLTRTDHEFATLVGISNSLKEAADHIKTFIDLGLLPAPLRINEFLSRVQPAAQVIAENLARHTTKQWDDLAVTFPSNQNTPVQKQ